MPLKGVECQGRATVVAGHHMALGGPGGEPGLLVSPHELTNSIIIAIIVATYTSVITIITITIIIIIIIIIINIIMI